MGSRYGVGGEASDKDRSPRSDTNKQDSGTPHHWEKVESGVAEVCDKRKVPDDEVRSSYFGMSNIVSVECCPNNAVKNRRIDGLFAIVMPAGGGKTTMAGMLCQLDIDQILCDDVEYMIRDVRVAAQRMAEGAQRRLLWMRHNKLWYDACYYVLRNYDFSTDNRVLFCHTPEVALACGAEVIGIFSPSDELHEGNLRNSRRSDTGVNIGRENRRLVETTCSGLPTFKRYNSHAELEVLVASTISTKFMCPGLASMLFRNNLDYLGVARMHGYLHVPEHIIRSEYSPRDIDLLVELAKEEKIPWWHVSEWLEVHSPKLCVDGAIHRNCYEWLRLLSAIGIARGPDREVISREDMTNHAFDWMAVYPYSKTIYKTRASLRLRHIVALCPPEWREVVRQILNAHIGEEHNFVACIVAYAIGILPTLREHIARSVIDSCMLMVSEDKWHETHTTIHHLVRNTQTLFGHDLTDKEYSQLQYTTNLLGRRTYVVDPTEEIAKRGLLRLDQKTICIGGEDGRSYWDTFKAGVIKAYESLGSKPSKLESDFSSFFTRRGEWVTGGAVTNLPPDLQHLKEPEMLLIELQDGLRAVYENPTKKGVMERLRSPGEVIRMLYEHWGYNDGGVAPKPNEPGKERVLLPGSFLHYLAMSYLLHIIESSGIVGGVRLGNVEELMWERYTVPWGNSVFHFMLDFADHNAQHSIPEMQYIIAALDEVYKRVGVDSNVAWFSDWVIESFENMRIKNKDGEFETINSGLYSGWRGTTWINTVACQAYIHVGLEYHRRRYGGSGLIHFDGAGDDVHTIFTSASKAIQFYQCMRAAGFEMQDTKQMFSHRRSEFLRHITTQSGIYTCINRMLPGFICGDLERSNQGIMTRAGTGFAICMTLRRRGLSTHAANGLFVGYLRRWLKYEHGGTLHDVPPFIIHARTSDNGFGVPTINGTLYCLNVPLPPLPVETGTILNTAGWATKDRVNCIAEELKTLGIELTCRGMLERDLSQEVYPISKYLNEDLLTSSAWIAYVRSKRQVVDVIEYDGTANKAMLYDMRVRIRQPDYNEWLRSYNRYKRYRDLLKYTNASIADLTIALGCQGYDHEMSARFRGDVYAGFSVPEFVLHNVGNYCRFLCGTSEVDLLEARSIFTIICNTYREEYGADF